MYLARQPLLSLYSSGHNLGVTVESGDGVSFAVPIYCCGFFSPYANQRLLIGGRDLTNYLMDLLDERGFSFTPLLSMRLSVI